MVICTKKNIKNLWQKLLETHYGMYPKLEKLLKIISDNVCIILIIKYVPLASDSLVINKEITKGIFISSFIVRF